MWNKSSFPGTLNSARLLHFPHVHKSCSLPGHYKACQERQTLFNDGIFLLSVSENTSRFTLSGPAEYTWLLESL